MTQEKLEKLEQALGLSFSYADLLGGAILESQVGQSAEALVLIHEGLLPKQEEADKRAQIFAALKAKHELDDAVLADLVDLAYEKVMSKPSAEGVPVDEPVVAEPGAGGVPIPQF